MRRRVSWHVEDSGGPVATGTLVDLPLQYVNKKVNDLVDQKDNRRCFAEHGSHKPSSLDRTTEKEDA